MRPDTQGDCRLSDESDPRWQRFIRRYRGFQQLCRKAGFDENQPRVPAGNPDGGQWSDSGSTSGGSASGGITDRRILSDATPDNDWKPGARYASRRRFGNQRLINGRLLETTPAQDARLAVAEAQAQREIAKVREVDPDWRPTPSAYESVEGLISSREAEAEPARARFLELQKYGIAPGPFAGKSVPARGEKREFTAAERREINRIGSESGCHTCGDTDPKTKYGDFVPDHQPSIKWNPNRRAYRLFPQCLKCSLKQGGWISTRGKKE